jgi:hypothetical protein
MYYADEARKRAEEAVAAFLATEVANGNVSQDEAGSWVWQVEDAVWPIDVETPVDPAMFDGDECEADYPCSPADDFMCAVHYLEETGYDAPTHAEYDSMVARVIAHHDNGGF